MKGHFFGVGVGPGDPELLTLKAVKIINAGDVIIAPKTEKKGDSTALAIAKEHIDENAEIVPMTFPMVNSAESLSNAWKDNKDAILKYLEEGKKVVFLTLGDPMLYSTYMYVYRLLTNSGYPITTIPGITAFCSIASRVGVPLAEGEEVLTIVPATSSEEELDKAIAASDNLVLMKVYKNFPQVVKKLKDTGRFDKTVLVSKCGLPDEEIIYDLEKAVAEGKKVNYLSTMIAKGNSLSKKLVKESSD